MSAVAASERLTLRRVEITTQGDGRCFARLLFLSKVKSDERSIGPLPYDELIELVGRIKFAVEVMGKKAEGIR